MRDVHTAAVLLGVLSVLPAAIAQAPSPQRRAAVGIVEGSEGPLAGASVTLVGHHTGATFENDVDVVEVKADDNGRWRASLLVGMPYFGFAAGPWLDGQCELSSVRGWFGAGAIVEFVCTSRVNARTIDVRGAESWLSRPGYRVAARPYLATGGPQICMPISLPLTRTDDRVFAYPRAPFGRVEVQDERGLPVWRSEQSVESMTNFAMSPPSEFACEVVDEAGAPIAGATVHMRGEGIYDSGVDGLETTRVFPTRLVATTGADGRARMLLPLSPPLFSKPAVPARMFVARADGYAEQVCGARGNDMFVEGVRRPGAAPDVLRFRLTKSETMRGVLRQAAGGAGARVQLRQVAKLRLEEDGFFHENRVAAADLGPDGSFALAGIDRDLHQSQWLVHPSASEPPIALSMRDGLATIEDLERDMTRLGTVSIQATDEGAGPAAGQCIYARSEYELPEQGTHGVIRWVADSGGRISTKLQEGLWSFVAASALGYAAATVSVEAGVAHKVELRLKPWPVMRGFVCDEAGAPIAGATFSLRPNWNIRRSLTGVEWMIARWSMRLLPTLSQRVRSEQDGTFAVALPAHDLNLQDPDEDNVPNGFAPRRESESPHYSVLVSAKGKRSVVVSAAVGDEPLKVVLH
jgi:hypothetical protein